MCGKLTYLISFLLVLALAGTNVAFGAIVWEGRISSGDDDVEEGVPGGGIDLSSSDLEMPYEDEGKGNPQVIGLRFVNVAIAQGAQIAGAYIEFEIDEDKGGTQVVNLIIDGELSPDAAAFSSSANVANRPRTTAKVQWGVPKWTTVGVKSQTADISAIIQEIVNQDGWKSGNALVLAIGDDPANPSEGVRCAKSYNGDAFGAALLHIEIPTTIATQPDPADGTLYQDTWAALSWSPGLSAVSHDVYFGENFADVEAGIGGTAVGSSTDALYIIGISTPGDPYPDGLAAGVTYYWRVDEKEADGTTHKGDVWSFTILFQTAYDPDPPDGARSVEPNVKLSWTAGFGAKLHTVYFGDNFDDVNSAAGGAPQGTTSYTPGPLELDKTYYWRVDEFDGAETHTGDVWSFKTRPPITITDPNLIGWWKLDEGLGNNTVDSSGHGNHGTFVGDPQWVTGLFGAALEFDGMDDLVDCGNSSKLDFGTGDWSVCAWIKTTQSSKGTCFAKGGDSSGGIRYTVAIGEQETGRITLTTDDDNSKVQPTSSSIVSDDIWHHVVGMRDGTTLSVYIDGVPDGTATIAAEYNLSGTSQHNALLGAITRHPNATPEKYFDGVIDDVRVYNKALTREEIAEIMKGDTTLASDPSPANGSTTDIERATPLSWSPGDNAAEHDVYFGTDKNAVTDTDTSDTSGIYRGRQSLTAYTPPEGVEWGGGPYYWRIDEYNTDATVSTGSLWNFTVADYLIVDDMESYNDLDPADPASNRIFNVWIDGYGIDTNGSIVGYDVAPFAEQTIVHSGRQSMPFAYDNSGTARHSEATLTLTQRDWTKEGVGTLTVWFRGDSANTAAPMYITLNGTATVYHNNPDAALISTWTQWNIPLSDFSNQGVVLTNVNSITIGLGDRNNPQAGGEGTMFFDDIRLYR